MARSIEDSGTATEIVTFAAVNKWFGDFHVLRDINMVVGRGEKVVVCGPSGSGKSTMIRCITSSNASPSRGR